MGKIINFVGIDVSKKTLDIALVIDGKKILSTKIDNSEKGIKSFLKTFLKKEITLENTVFCMEFSGVYNFRLLQVLLEFNAKIWLENPLHIKRSLGLIRGKNDKADAQRIAIFAFKNIVDMKLWKPKRKIIEELKALSNVRNMNINSIERFMMPIREAKEAGDKLQAKLLRKHSINTIKALVKDKNQIEKQMLDLIKSDEKLNHLFEIITSIPHVGKITAITMIIATNEFEDFTNPRKFSCYGGMAPFDYSSGTSVKGKTRVSNLAKKELKTLFNMVAISSVSKKGEMKNYFERKVAEGKNKMLVLNNIRNKFVLRIFSCVKHNKYYNRELFVV